MTVTSRAASGEIEAMVELAQRSHPCGLWIRLRHPAARPMRSVSVNGPESGEFGADREWVRIDDPSQPQCTIVARY